MELTIALIESAKTNMEAANKVFRIAEQTIVIPFARKRCEHQWEDVSQSTLMKAWIGFRTFRGSVFQFVQWMRTICFREVVALWRKSRDVAALEHDPFVDDDYCELWSILDRKEFDVVRALSQGYTMRDIAKSTTRPLSRVHREATNQRSHLLQLIG